MKIFVLLPILGWTLFWNHPYTNQVSKYNIYAISPGTTNRIFIGESTSMQFFHDTTNQFAYYVTALDKSGLYESLPSNIAVTPDYLSPPMAGITIVTQDGSLDGIIYVPTPGAWELQTSTDLETWLPETNWWIGWNYVGDDSRRFWRLKLKE